jgi:hypothetical protein
VTAQHILAHHRAQEKILRPIFFLDQGNLVAVFWTEATVLPFTPLEISYNGRY